MKSGSWHKMLFFCVSILEPKFHGFVRPLLLQNFEKSSFLGRSWPFVGQNFGTFKSFSHNWTLEWKKQDSKWKFYKTQPWLPGKSYCCATNLRIVIMGASSVKKLHKTMKFSIRSIADFLYKTLKNDIYMSTSWVSFSEMEKAFWVS